jgi:PBP1b-binding outer membrane lipoprotein LpoB
MKRYLIILIGVFFISGIAQNKSGLSLKVKEMIFQDKADSVDLLLIKITKTYKELYETSLHMIDSLNNKLKLKDIDFDILLKRIESDLEKLSDAGLNYLNEIRKK